MQITGDASIRRDGVLTAGDRLGRYEIIALIARGGMGAVYLARAAGAGGFTRLFALKVMHPHLADEEEFVHMLVDEARVASRIHHPNAVAIVDLAESPYGYCLAMDYVEGVTLTQLRRTPRLADEVKTRVGLRVLLDALAGLHAAHELTDDEGNALRIVHRDVSPHNILIGADGVGRITDFGIALAVARITASRPGMIKGKPQYMAPEQVASGPVDRRADVFCAGIILWEFLTRGRLFQADTEAGAMMMVHAAPIPPPSLALPLPTGFDDVCLKALERDPERRYPTARAFADALEAVIAMAGWSLSTNAVAEHVSAAFADELAERKALIRDHGKPEKSARMPAPAPAAPNPALIASDPLGPTRPIELPEGRSVSAPRAAPEPAPPAKETSQSVPAIEVPPALNPHARRAGASPRSRRGTASRIVAAVAVVTSALVVGLWLRRHAPAPRTASAASPPTSPVPPRAPDPVETPAVREPPAAPAVEPAPAVTAASPAPPAALTAPVATTAEGATRDPARRHRRTRGADGGAGATPAAPTGPELEINPYLRR